MSKKILIIPTLALSVFLVGCTSQTQPARTLQETNQAIEQEKHISQDAPSETQRFRSEDRRENRNDSEKRETRDSQLSSSRTERSRISSIDYKSEIDRISQETLESAQKAAEAELSRQPKDRYSFLKLEVDRELAEYERETLEAKRELEYSPEFAEEILNDFRRESQELTGDVIEEANGY